jgi:hypothetical protein
MDRRVCRRSDIRDRHVSVSAALPQESIGAQKDPLRPLAKLERRALEQLARSHSAPRLSVARAHALLAVSDGCSSGRGTL